MNIKIFILFIIFLVSSFDSQANDHVFYAKKYGLVADGKTDNYAAFARLTHDVNRNKGGKIVFEKGIYVINQYKNTGNGVQDLSYRYCTNLTFHGNNTIIKLTNNFKKKIDRTRGTLRYSNSASITPFAFSNVKLLKINDIIVDGGNENAQKAVGIGETAEHLFSFSNCSDVTLSNVNAIGSLCDGFYIKDNNRNFTFTNVKSLNNARQGLSIIGLWEGKFLNCEFSKSGRSKYGYHPPAAGLDIEPNKRDAVKNIIFSNCTFYNNRNAQIVISRPDFTNNVLIENSNIDAGTSTYPYQLILSAKNIKLIGNKINLNTGAIYPFWANYENSSIQIKNNQIISKGRGIVASGNKNFDVLIEGNHLKFIGMSMSSYFPYIKYPVIFKSNTIEVPEKFLNKKYISLVQNAKESSNNKFITDKGHSFKSKVSYSKTNKINE
jgi:hypothetical protein